jgi:GST-like protein
MIPRFLGEAAWDKLPSVKRLLDEINAKPCAKRVEEIATRYSFKTEVDEESRRNLFPSNERLKRSN